VEYVFRCDCGVAVFLCGGRSLLFDFGDAVGLGLRWRCVRRAVVQRSPSPEFMQPLGI
jgi:hypothetical protein